MKTKLLKHFSLRATMLVALVCAAFTGAWADTETITLWSEDFSSFAKDAVPSGGDFDYACTNGSGTTKIYTENTAGGTSPELLVGKSNGTFTATISDLKGCTGPFTLTFITNQTNLKPSVKSKTSTGSGTATGTVSGSTNSKKTSTYTITPANNATNLIITFTITTSSNARLDDIVLTGKKEDVTDTRTATTVTIDDSGITNTNVYSGTAAGSFAAIVKADGEAITDATVTWSSEDEGVATINATTGAVTLVGAGSTTITASYAGTENEYQPSSETYTLNVTNADPNVKGGENNPYTVAEASEIILAYTNSTATTEKYYVKGIVSRFFNTSVMGDGTNYRYYISDDGETGDTEVMVFRGAGLNGEAFSNADDLQIGDEVIVYGPFQKYNSTAEVSSGNYIVSLKRKAAIAEINDITPKSIAWNALDNFTLDATFAEGTVKDEDYIIVWETSNNEILELADETYEGKGVAGDVTVTVTITPDDETTYKEVSKSFTVNVYDPRTEVNMTGFTASATTLNVSGTAITNVTNDQEGWTAAYTYESDNTGVATVDANGVITAVAVGEATITATLNVTGEEYKAGTTTSMTVDITVTATPTHTIYYSINGDNSRTDSAAEGDEITLPTDVDGIGGLDFLGWSATEDNPVLLTENPTMGTSNVTYYAVFGKAVNNLETGTLTESEITGNITNTACAYGTEKTYNDESDGITWIASGYAEAGRKWIQLKKEAADAYIKVSSSSDITKLQLTITSASNSSGGIADITKHTAFSGTVCLEASAVAKPTGTYGSSNSVTDNTITIVPTSSVKELYIQMTGGASRIWGIEVTSGTVSYTNLTTTISESVTVGEAGYVTYVTEHEVSFPTDVTAYIVTEVKENSIHLEEIADAPAGVPVIIKATEGTHALEFGYAGLYESAGTNLLQVSDGTVTGGSTILALAKKKDVVGFYPVSNSITIPEGKAYLEVSSPVKDFLGFEGTETGISNMNAENVNGTIYNLAGQRVNHAQKGIFIVNGKKVVK